MFRYNRENNVKSIFRFNCVNNENGVANITRFTPIPQPNSNFVERTSTLLEPYCNSTNDI